MQDTRSHRILLIEDDRTHRWVVRRVLENALGGDIVVEEADSGESGLNRLGRRPKIDLLLLDLHLPDMSGFEVLKHLRSEVGTRGLPVVVLTSSQDREDVRKAFECGANSFVSKSETPELMMRRLQMLPVYWLELNRLPDDAV